MEPNAILSADPLDLLFENRNKNYGAYTLRKYYDRRLMTGLAVSLSAGSIFFCLLNLGPKPLPVTDVTLLPDVVLKNPPVAPTVKPKLPVVRQRIIHSATVSDAVYRIVPDRLADKPIHMIEELDKAQIGVSELAGPPETGMPAAGAGNGTGTETPAVVKEVVREIYKIADVMPHFPGGQEALMRFLSRNLRMPEGAEAGTKVSVLATFVVGTDGKVKQAEMTRSGGERFDAEVKRVLAKMPAWIPGKMGQRTVAVYFTLPVQFVVPEE